MIIPIVATIIRALWVSVEIPFVRRHRTKPIQGLDKHSGIFWDVANAIEPIGMILGFAGIGKIETDGNFPGLCGLLLLIAGIAIRWTAIYSLGKYFTYIVTIKEDHRIIQDGLYRHLRHPSYAGALLAHLGLGLAFSNWFSLFLGFVPFLIAALYRMHVEEQALRDSFGAEYVEYATRTKRLIPKIY